MILIWVSFWFLILLDVQQKEGAKNEGEKKPAAADAGAKKDDGPTPVILKLDLHCEGCAKKVKRALRSFDGKHLFLIH